LRDFGEILRLFGVVRTWFECFLGCLWYFGCFWGFALWCFGFDVAWYFGGFCLHGVFAVGVNLWWFLRVCDLVFSVYVD